MIDPERSEKIAAALRDRLRAGIEMIPFPIPGAIQRRLMRPFRTAYAAERPLDSEAFAFGEVPECSIRGSASTECGLSVGAQAGDAIGNGSMTPRPGDCVVAPDPSREEVDNKIAAPDAHGPHHAPVSLRPECEWKHGGTTQVQQRVATAIGVG